MAVGLDAITVIHNAFRRDMAEIDAAAYQIAAKGGDLTNVLDRLRYSARCCCSTPRAKRR